MKIDNLRSLIRESISEYIKEIDEAGTRAMYEAKMTACDGAINKRKQKIEMAESLEEMQGMFDETKIGELKKEIKMLEKQKAKYGKMLEKMNKGKEVVTEEPTEAMTEDTPIDETDVMAEIDLEEAKKKGKSGKNTFAVDNIDAREEDKPFHKGKTKHQPVDEITINESFLKMQKLAGLITEGQMREKLQKLNELDAPAYEFINDLMDEINMATGMKGKLTPYSKIPWLPEVHSTDDPENTWMLVYKKGNQEIAIGQDDVYQEDMWQINTNDPNLDFGQDLKANQVVDAVSDWLNS
jgi:hypothetical protein